VTELIATQQASLRERKKARTRASIREHALRLFREQGYQATTVEQIAAAAEVSPSTFFRYFPTKEDVVLQDEFDVRIIEAFGRQPPELSPVAAVRAALKDAVTAVSAAEWEQLRQAAALQMTVPEIRARMFDDMNRLIHVMADALAKRTGRVPEDLAVRTLVGATFGVMMSVAMPYHETAGATLARDVEFIMPADMFDRMDEALALLEAGLPL
jgi:AcrR family transcriptional regulator